MCSSKKSRLTPSIAAASFGTTVTRRSALFGRPVGSGAGAAVRSRLSCSLAMVGTYMIRLMIATLAARLLV